MILDVRWHQRFLALADQVATWSKDPSTQVGAVIVRPDRTIASLGYNGLPRRMPDRADWLEDRDEKYSRIIHAEMNALLAAREPVTGYTLYTVPFAPCERCLVHMAQAGITLCVAYPPLPTHLERWGAAFTRAREYAATMGVTMLQVDR